MSATCLRVVASPVGQKLQIPNWCNIERQADDKDDGGGGGDDNEKGYEAEVHRGNSSRRLSMQAIELVTSCNSILAKNNFKRQRIEIEAQKERCWQSFNDETNEEEEEKEKEEETTQRGRIRRGFEVESCNNQQISFNSSPKHSIVGRDNNLNTKNCTLTSLSDSLALEARPLINIDDRQMSCISEAKWVKLRRLKVEERGEESKLPLAVQQLTRSKSFAQFLTCTTILLILTGLLTITTKIELVLATSLASGNHLTSSINQQQYQTDQLPMNNLQNHHNHHHHSSENNNNDQFPLSIGSLQVKNKHHSEEFEQSQLKQHHHQSQLHNQQQQQQNINPPIDQQQQHHESSAVYEYESSQKPWIDHQQVSSMQTEHHLNDDNNNDHHHHHHANNPQHWTTTTKFHTTLDNLDSSASTNHPQQQQQDSQTSSFRSILSSTTPTLNRQIIPPPQQQQHHSRPFYDIGLIPTNALQLEPQLVITPSQPIANLYNSAGNLNSLKTTPSSMQTSSMNNHHNHQYNNGVQNYAKQTHNNHMQQMVAESVLRPTIVAIQNGLGDNGPSHSAANQQSSSQRANGTSSSLVEHSARGQRQLSYPNEIAPKEQQQQQARDSSSSNNSDGSNQAESQDTGQDSNKSESQTNEKLQQQQPVDKGIEPRQRRRLFNRILKKAEWNHLFFELSKVFLRYFLDLALKDIIGKQSGGTSSGDSSSGSTTGRKKLDAQSELADLLRDSIKTAISNI